MSAKAILQEMLELVKAEIEAVKTGDHQKVLDGALRHEQLLSALETAEWDAPPEELRALAAELDREKTKLQSLVTAEAARVDFLLRLMLGSGAPKASGYPTGDLRRQGQSYRLNRRT
jgi:hypothetical protein